MSLRRIGISALAVLLLAFAAPYAQAADPGGHGGIAPLLTTTPTPTPTWTPIPTTTPNPVETSIHLSASTVAVGDTIVVTGTSTLGMPYYYLNVYDASTGQLQSETSPLLTPARPALITYQHPPTVWTLTAVRAGQVKLVLSVSGEVCSYEGGHTSLCYWGNDSATAAVTTYTPPIVDLTSTPTYTPTPTSSPPLASAAVSFSASTVAVGDTIVVTGTSTLGMPTYQLYVIDADTGGVQSQEHPFFTPAQLSPITITAGAVSWTLTAAQAGRVTFTILVSGEKCSVVPGQGTQCVWSSVWGKSSTVTILPGEVGPGDPTTFSLSTPALAS